MLAAENIGLDCSGQLVSRRRNFILCLRPLSSFAIFFFTRNAFLYLVAVCHPPFQKGIMRNPNGHFELFQEYHHDKSQEVTLVLELGQPNEVSISVSASHANGELATRLEVTFKNLGPCDLELHSARVEWE